MAKPKKNNVSNITSIIVRNLESLRLQRNWSRDELATRLHVGKNTYENYVSGRTLPQTDILDHASRAFNLPVTAFIMPIEVQIRSRYE